MPGSAACARNGLRAAKVSSRRASSAAPAGSRAIEDLCFVAYVADCFINAPPPGLSKTYDARSNPHDARRQTPESCSRPGWAGVQVTAVGVVGDDGIGRDALAVLDRERIDISGIESHGEAAATICLCFVSDEGESAIVWHIDDDVAVMPENVHAADSAIDRADAVLMTFELPVPTIRETISLFVRIWEGFRSRWHIAAVNRDSSAYQKVPYVDERWPLRRVRTVRARRATGPAKRCNSPATLGQVRR